LKNAHYEQKISLNSNQFGHFKLAQKRTWQKEKPGFLNIPLAKSNTDLPRTYKKSVFRLVESN